MKVVKDSEQDKDIKNIEVNDAKEVKPAPMLQLPLAEVQNFMQILGIMLINDDRLQPIKSHFVEILKRNNEHIKEQSE